MKKVIILTFLVGLFACRKEKLPPNNGGNNTTVNVSFKRDSSVVEQTIQPAKNGYITFSSVLNTGSVNGFQVTSVEVSLKKLGDASEPRSYMKRIYFTIEDAGSVTFTSPIKDSVVNNTFSFDNFLKNYGQFKTLTIKLYADILSTATNGTGLEDGMTVEMKVFYTHGGSAIPNQTNVVVGHKTTFSTASQPFSVSSYADSTNPTGAVVLEGQNSHVLHYAVGVSGQSGSINLHKFLIQGQGSSAVKELKLYSGNSLLGQVFVNNNVCSITTSEPLTSGTRKFYYVVPVLSVNPTNSNYDFSVVLDETSGVSVAGEQKFDGTDRFGNFFTPLKTTLLVERIPISTQVINDSTEEDTYQLRISNTGLFPAAFKQISFGIVWANNSPGSIDTLELKPRLLCNSVQPSGLWTNQNGDTSSGGFFRESVSIITFTFTSEQVVNGGSSVVVLLKTFRRGFKTTNDGFRVKPIFDPTRVDLSYKFVNKGTVGLSMKLFSSSSQNVSANPFKQLFIYSDMCDLAHSPVPGLSSKDWLSGFGFAELPDQVWVR
jgi:hypothetical protein